MVTYNHEPYIAEAIEGVLMQETTFPYQLVIGEDCSTDGTRAICEAYAAQYPDKIKLLPSEENLGMGRNYRRTLEACTGKYIAMCEGDDYWISSDKLQKQVNFLEKNAEYSGSYHNTYVGFNNEKTNNTLFRPVLKDEMDILDVISFTSPFHTTSFIFKKDAIPEELYSTFHKVHSLDMLVFYLSSINGKLKKIANIYSFYRKHPNGITNTDHHKGRLYHLERIKMIELWNNIYSSDKIREKSKIIITNHLLSMISNTSYVSLWLLVKTSLLSKIKTRLTFFKS